MSFGRNSKYDLVLLMGAMLSLVQACGGGSDGTTTDTGSKTPNSRNTEEGNSEGTEPTENTESDKYIKFQSLTFDGKNEVLKGEGDKVDFSAIGKNNGSAVYFGTNSNKGTVYVYDVQGNTVTPVKLTAVNVDKDKPGMSDFNINLTGRAADAAVITKIVAGPVGTQEVVLSVTGLKAETGFGVANKGGIAVLDAAIVKDIRRNNAVNLDAGESHTIGANDGANQDITALGVIGANWVAFVRDLKSYGTHQAFANNNAKSVKGPTLADGKGLGKIVTAVASKGNDLLLATFGRIDKIDGANLDTAVVDFAAQPLLASDDFMFEGAAPEQKNDVVTAVAAMGDEVIVGLRKTGNNTGGIATVKIDGSAKVKPSLNVNVKNINVSADGTSAFITVDDGFVFYIGGKFYHITDAAAAAALTKETATPIKPAFVGNITDEFKFDKIVGATNIRDKWYVAVDGAGGFNFTVRAEQRKEAP